MRIWYICVFAVLLTLTALPAEPVDDDGQPLLPRGMAPHEVGVPRVPILTLTPPPTQPVRAMAEWEEVEAILVRWPNSVSLNSLYAQFLAPVALDLKIYVLCASANQANAARNYFLAASVPIDSMIFQVQATNSIWIRDYGPWWIWRQESSDRSIVDWIYNRPRPLDDAIPELLAGQWGIPYYGPNLVFTGGNFMVDGWGRGFCSELVFDENGTAVDTIAELDSVMDAYMDLDTVYTFPRFFGIDHIDMSMKLLNDHTLILNEYPDGNAFNTVMDSCEEIFEGITNPWGQPVSVHRIATPSWAGGVPYTYTNGIIINNKALIPIYGLAGDAPALELWRELLPGYSVYGFNCNAIVTLQGTIHCVVKEVIHRRLIRIEYKPLPQALQTPEQATIRARVTSLGTLNPDSILMFYSLTQAGPWYRQLLQPISPDSFAVTIPPATAGAPVYYYIYAANVEGNHTSMPRYGPGAHYVTTFLAGEPRPPAGLMIYRQGDDLVIQWDKVSEDVNGVPLSDVSYRLYHSAVSDSVVAPGNLLLETFEHLVILPRAARSDDTQVFYQVTSIVP